MEEVREDEDGDGTVKSYFLMPTDISGEDAAKAVRMTYILNAGTDYGTEGEKTDFAPTPYGSEELRRITERQQANSWSYNDDVGFVHGNGGRLMTTPNGMMMGLGGNIIQDQFSQQGGTAWGDTFMLDIDDPADPAQQLREVAQSGHALVRGRRRPVPGFPRPGQAAAPRGAPRPAVGARGLHRLPRLLRVGADHRRQRDRGRRGAFRWRIPLGACAPPAPLLLAAVTAACDTKAPYTPSLPPAAGFRVDDGVLKLWTGTPCDGVTGLRLTFDSGAQESTGQLWTAPQPGVRMERMDLLTTDGSLSPDTDNPLQVKEPLPADYDWTKAGSLTFSVDGPRAYGAKVDLARVLSESAQHPPERYLFGQRGWMTASGVHRENRTSFLTVCTPDPG